jgi:hypothetical protein
MSLGPEIKFGSDLVQVGRDQSSDLADNGTIARVERVEDFRRTVTSRHVQNLIRSKYASLRQFPAIRFQPDLRLAVIDPAGVQLSVFVHHASSSLCG